MLLHAIGVHGLALLAVPAVLLARTVPAARQLRVIALAVAAVGMAAAILAAHAFRELPWNQMSALALAALALCAVALLAAYWTITAALWFRHHTEE